MSKENKYCTECGTENIEENEFCTECGHAFKKTTEEDAPDNETVKKQEAIVEEPSSETSEEAKVTSPDDTPKEAPQETPIEAKNTATKTQNEGNNTLDTIKNYIMTNKKVVGIASALIVIVIALSVFLSGSAQAQGAWMTTDEEYYNRRQHYTVDFSRNGNVEVLMQHSDGLNGTIKLDFTVVEDEWETTETRTAYVLDELNTLEVVVPNLTYQYERGDILSEFGSLGVDYDINEGSDEVTVTFDLTEHSDVLFGRDLETVIELVSENDRDNVYHEDYLIFRGFDGTKELFNQ